jgi:hypothetical protein
MSRREIYRRRAAGIGDRPQSLVRLLRLGPPQSFREAAMPAWITPVTLMVLASMIGCVPHPPVDAHSGDGTGPRLISCAEGPALDKTRSRTSVELRFTVNTEGRVDPASLRLVPNMNASTASESAVRAAREAALSCVYAPAMRGGHAVAMSVTRWFTVDLPEASIRRP